MEKTPEATTGEPAAAQPGTLRAVAGAIRTRVLSGLVLALPIAITIWILYWLYSTLQALVLGPLARWIGPENPELPFWWERVTAPLIAVALAFLLLYFLGYLVHSRLANAIDWTFSRVPFVTIIYKAVRNVFQSLASLDHDQRFRRVVLVEFPCPGSRALAFVTKSLQDGATEKTILCVCVLTGVFPPTGFTLFVPEENVVELDWTVNQTLQAILSGGITSPAAIRYYPGPPFPDGTGPIIDTHGHPFEETSQEEPTSRD